MWDELTILWNDLTIDWNDLTWNDLTMERNDRKPLGLLPSFLESIGRFSFAFTVNAKRETSSSCLS